MLVLNYLIKCQGDMDGLSEELSLTVSKRNYRKDMFSDIMVVVDEVYSNLIKYGGGSQMDVSFYELLDDIELILSDDGRAFNPLELDGPDLDLPIEEREVGGLGITLITAMTKAQEYSRINGQNCLKLKLSLCE